MTSPNAIDNNRKDQRMGLNAAITAQQKLLAWQHPITTKLVALLAIAVALFLGLPPANAQVSTATMFGTITDASGAAIPDANVTLRQTDTGFVRVVKTGGGGEYRADFLPIGPYSVTVEAGRPTIWLFCTL